MKKNWTCFCSRAPIISHSAVWLGSLISLHMIPIVNICAQCRLEAGRYECQRWWISHCLCVPCSGGGGFGWCAHSWGSCDWVAVHRERVYLSLAPGRQPLWNEWTLVSVCKRSVYLFYWSHDWMSVFVCGFLCLYTCHGSKCSNQISDCLAKLII